MAEKHVELLSPTPYPNHGNTVAAWVLVSLVCLGVIVGAVGFSIFSQTLLILGLVIVVLGIVAGIAMRAAGFGQGGARTKYKHH
ncbi:HGxxPAAW family protein [Rothia sp. LK2588]|uniref:HGxxPAAW family protein n=1 Tax=Rothia sp. LK2588 TaxID=3114369 RepID=UPI0034CD7459